MPVSLPAQGTAAGRWESQRLGRWAIARLLQPGVDGRAAGLNQIGAGAGEVGEVLGIGRMDGIQERVRRIALSYVSALFERTAHR